MERSTTDATASNRRRLQIFLNALSSRCPIIAGRLHLRVNRRSTRSPNSRTRTRVWLRRAVKNRVSSRRISAGPSRSARPLAVSWFLHIRNTSCQSVLMFRRPVKLRWNVETRSAMAVRSSHVCPRNPSSSHRHHRAVDIHRRAMTAEGRRNSDHHRVSLYRHAIPNR